MGSISCPFLLAVNLDRHHDDYGTHRTPLAKGTSAVGSGCELFSLVAAWNPSSVCVGVLFNPRMSSTSPKRMPSLTRWIDDKIEHERQ